MDESTPPIFGSEEFENLIRDDSYLSSNPQGFSELLRSPTLPLTESTDDSAELSTEKLNGITPTEGHIYWDDLGEDDNLISHIAVVPVKEVLALDGSVPLIDPRCDNIFEGDGSIEEISENYIEFQRDYNEISRFKPSLSTEQYEGDYDFCISLNDSNKGKGSKWCYNEDLKKLYVMPLVAVPVQITVSSWIDAYINITPVYKASKDWSIAVERCYNHRMGDQGRPGADHIVQLENEDATYKSIGNRLCVEMPLGFPAPGESSRTMYIKCGCWNTCVGGPNRRQLLFLFTLFSRDGTEIGRQVLEVKSCQCPIRDMANEDGSKKTKKTKAKQDVSKTHPSKKIKTEPVEVTFEQISVPSVIAADVKRYINMLIAERLAKETAVQKLPYPDFS